MKFSIDEMLERLPLPATEKWKEGVWDLEPFEKAGVKLVFFAPRGRDYQTSHDQDEFGGVSVPFEAGDVLFVEAGVDHRFDEFTDDLATWAIFF